MFHDTDRMLELTSRGAVVVKNIVAEAGVVKQPLFCGAEAFLMCLELFGQDALHGDHYIFAHCDDTKIILSLELPDKNIFTCPFINFSANLNNSYGACVGRGMLQ